MKKISILASIAIAVLAFVGCGKSAPKADLKSDVDTLSYAFGLEQSQGVQQYLQQMEIDSAYINEFLKGVSEAAQVGDNKKDKAYYAGLSVGQQIAMMHKGYSRQLFQNDSTQQLSLKNLLAGFIAGATGKDTLMSPETARTVGQQIATSIQTKQAEKTYAKEKKASDDFMAANAKKEGIKTLAKGVQYKVLKEGKGAIPTAGSTVTINYEGKTIEGKTFDKRDGAKMNTNGAIAGFSEALTHMPIGSKWEIYIPYSAAYGAQQAGPDIKPFSALIFTVELLSAEAAPKPTTPQVVQQAQAKAKAQAAKK